MIPSIQLSVLIGVAAAIWAIQLLISGVDASSGLLRPFSSVTGIMGLILVVFNKWLWRFPFLQPWFVAVPNIRGVWKAEIRSTWVNPETGLTLGPIAGFMVIRQDYISLSMRLITKESASKLLASRIICEADGLYQVAGLYCNEPKHSIRGRSQIHYGSLVLRVIGTPPSALDGHYWTDRGTQGELHLSQRLIEFPEDFESADRLFQTPAETR